MICDTVILTVWCLRLYGIDTVVYTMTPTLSYWHMTMWHHDAWHHDVDTVKSDVIWCWHFGVSHHMILTPWRWYYDADTVILTHDGVTPWCVTSWCWHCEVWHYTMFTLYDIDTVTLILWCWHRDIDTMMVWHRNVRHSNVWHCDVWNYDVWHCVQSDECTVSYDDTRPLFGSSSTTSSASASATYYGSVTLESEYCAVQHNTILCCRTRCSTSQCISTHNNAPQCCTFQTLLHSTVVQLPVTRALQPIRTPQSIFR